MNEFLIYNLFYIITLIMSLKMFLSVFLPEISLGVVFWNGSNPYPHIAVYVRSAFFMCLLSPRVYFLLYLEDVFSRNCWCNTKRSLMCICIIWARLKQCLYLYWMHFEKGQTQLWFPCWIFPSKDRYEQQKIFPE